MIIEEISIKNNEYPNQLKNIYDPPAKLYVLGNRSILNQKNFAIVGSRKATEYGKKVAMQISKELSENGLNIVSGLARGIDSYAHLGAIYAKGKTTAVLGSGIDIIYPKENFFLAEKIINTGGAIISEYPIGTKPMKINFPARNRIISGISEGLLVVEAKKKSGTLITVDFALEQGKEVFAVPGDINREQSEGCNLLIKDGANVVTSSQDIIYVIGK